MTGQKFYFSLEGIDVREDQALAVLAERVWKKATDASSLLSDKSGEPEENRGDSNLLDGGIQ